MKSPQAELIDYWIALAEQKGICREEPVENSKGKMTSPYRQHAVWFVKLLAACGKDVDRAKRALTFFFADNHPAVSTYGWSIGTFSKRYLGYVAKVKADDDMRARLAKRFTEEATERQERQGVRLPAEAPPQVLAKTNALRARWTGEITNR